MTRPRDDDSRPREKDSPTLQNEAATDTDGSDVDDATDTDEEYNVPIIVGGLIAGVFFGGVGAGVAFPTLPTLGGILGISPFVLGIILSMNRFTRLITNTPAGQLIDKLGPRKPMIAGLVCQGSAPFGYIVGLYHQSVPLIGAAEIFVLARAMWGLGSAFVIIGAFSTVVHITTESTRGKWVGYFRGGQALGVPAGLVLGGILADLYGYEAAFAAAGAAGVFAGIVAAVVLPDISGSFQTPARLRDIPEVIRADPRIFMIGSVHFTVRFLYTGVLLTTIVLYAEANGIAVSTFSAVGASGFFLAIAVLFSSATTFVSGNLSDSVDNRVLITLPALAVFAFGFALLGIVPTLTATLVGVACIGIGVGGTNPPLLAYLGDISPTADVGKMGGIYNVFGDVGSTLGPLVAIPVGAMIGYRTEYVLCAGLVLFTFLFVVYTLIGFDSETTKTPGGVTSE